MYGLTPPGLLSLVFGIVGAIFTFGLLVLLIRSWLKGTECLLDKVALEPCWPLIACSNLVVELLEPHRTKNLIRI